jgi:hypothetical protein
MYHWPTELQLLLRRIQVLLFLVAATLPRPVFLHWPMCLGYICVTSAQNISIKCLGSCKFVSSGSKASDHADDTTWFHGNVNANTSNDVTDVHLTSGRRTTCRHR